MVTVFIISKDLPHNGASEATVIVVEDASGKVVFGPENARAWGQVADALKDLRGIDLAAHGAAFLNSGIYCFRANESLIDWFRTRRKGGLIFTD